MEQCSLQTFSKNFIWRFGRDGGKYTAPSAYSEGHNKLFTSFLNSSNHRNPLWLMDWTAIMPEEIEIITCDHSEQIWTLLELPFPLMGPKNASKSHTHCRQSHGIPSLQCSTWRLFINMLYDYIQRYAAFPVHLRSSSHIVRRRSGRATVTAEAKLSN